MIPNIFLKICKDLVVHRYFLSITVIIIIILISVKTIAEQCLSENSSREMNDKNSTMTNIDLDESINDTFDQSESKGISDIDDENDTVEMVYEMFRNSLSRHFR